MATVTGTLAASTLNVAAGTLNLDNTASATAVNVSERRRRDASRFRRPAGRLAGPLAQRPAYAGGGESLGSLSLVGGTLAGSGLTATVGGSTPLNIQAGSVAANLSAGSLGLSKTTAGTAILSGANTYSGGTTVSGGVLQLGAAPP